MSPMSAMHRVNRVSFTCTKTRIARQVGAHSSRDHQSPTSRHDGSVPLELGRARELMPCQPETLFAATQGR